MKKLITLTMVFLMFFHNAGSNSNSRHKRMLVYKLRSVMGLFIALAVPIDVPNRDVFFSYVFEGNYYLPYSIAELGDMALFTPVTDLAREKRSYNRKTLYEVLEDQLISSGYQGRACLLRTICEIAAVPVTSNGILGDIAHIIFTPSSSKDEDLPLSFYKAEMKGRKGDCDNYVKKCPSNFLDIISIIQ